jgi:hypothetical protein
VAVALLCNSGMLEPGQAAQRVAAAVLDRALAAVPADPAGIAVDSAALARLAGTWHAPRTEQVLVLRASRGQLTDSTAGNAVLIPVAPDRFQYRGGTRTLTLLSDPNGKPMIRVEAPRARAIEYQRVPNTRPDARVVAGFAGEYRSPELGASLQLVASGDTLRLVRGWDPPILLRPLYQDAFVGPGVGILRFERGPRGAVTGAVLWAGRVRRLRFERQR